MCSCFGETDVNDIMNSSYNIFNTIVNEIENKLIRQDQEIPISGIDNETIQTLERKLNKCNELIQVRERVIMELKKFAENINQVIGVDQKGIESLERKKKVFLIQIDSFKPPTEEKSNSIMKVEDHGNILKQPIIPEAEVINCDETISPTKPIPPPKERSKIIQRNIETLRYFTKSRHSECIFDSDFHGWEYDELLKRIYHATHSMVVVFPTNSTPFGVYVPTRIHADTWSGNNKSFLVTFVSDKAVRIRFVSTKGRTFLVCPKKSPLLFLFTSFIKCMKERGVLSTMDASLFSLIEERDVGLAKTFFSPTFEMERFVVLRF